MEIHIKSLTPELYSQTIEMIQRTIRISQSSVYPPELIENFCKKYDIDKFKIKAQEIEYIIAEDTRMKKVVGIVGLKENELRTFFVDPDYQGKGIGRSLYNKLENIAKSRKINKIFLYGSPLGEPTYLKFGFKKINKYLKAT
jgi:N-acetylglutamate synthase-like GNAT family acetyltransferase